MKLNEIEIPKEIEVTLYTTICTNNKWEPRVGQIETYPFNKAGIYENDADESYLLLHEESVTLEIGKIEIDVRGEVVKGLEAQKTKELAEHEVKMQGLQDKIDGLLAIEYKSEKSAA